MPFEATDFVIGATYLTWGGRKIVLESFADGKFWWRDLKDGSCGDVRPKALASRVRSEIKS